MSQHLFKTKDVCFHINGSTDQLAKANELIEDQLAEANEIDWSYWQNQFNPEELCLETHRN